MAIPDFESIMLPLLIFAQDGQEHAVEDAEKYLAKFFDLSEEEQKQEKSSGKEPLFLNRLRWARLFLKKAGLVTDPKTSYYKITEEGKKILETKLQTIDVKYLKKIKQFDSWYTRKHPKQLESKAKHWKSIKTGKNFNKCSSDLKKSLLLAEKSYLTIRQRMLNDIKQLEKSKKNAKTKNEINDTELELQKLIDTYSMTYDVWDSEMVLAFSKIDEEYMKKIQESSTKEVFRDQIVIFENPELLSCLLDLKIDVALFFDEINDKVLANGQLSYNFDEHTRLLKFYVNYLPNSSITKNGVEYWLREWKNYSREKYAELTPIAFGLEALLDYDATKFQKEIQEHVDFILEHQDRKGAFKLKNTSNDDSAYCAITLSKILEYDHPSLSKVNEYLRKYLNRKHEYAWRQFSAISLALIALGDGPQVPQAWFDNQKRRNDRYLRQKTTQFIQTSPSNNKQEIFEKLTKMINEAINEIWIISPFVDMYSFLVDKATQNSNLKIKILSKPLNEFRGDRKRFAKAALDTLRKLTNVEIKISPIIHSRMIVVDSKMLIVSSADLTHDQLYDEFNSGLYTEDLDSIISAKTFFNDAFSNAQNVSNSE